MDFLMEHKGVRSRSGFFDRFTLSVGEGLAMTRLRWGSGGQAGG
jgi:hypothetical protein